MSESEVGYVLSIHPNAFVNVFLEWHAREGESPVTNKKGVFTTLANLVVFFLYCQTRFGGALCILRCVQQSVVRIQNSRVERMSKTHLCV